jgi:hypothetical protein
MMFNAWRSNAICVSSNVIDSDQCVTRKKLLSTYKIKIHTEIDGEKFQLKNVSRFVGQKAKKTSSVCMRCQVALCQACFRPWHDEEGLPPAPPDLGAV